jgi:DNA (cytosine-5)-methyltransferase 1
MKLLDIFSGIGGFSVGLERAGMETVAFCEIDKHCHKVLKKHWPEVPILKDISEVHVTDECLMEDSNSDVGYLDNKIDIIAGGFPCTDVSIAGKKKGLYDKKIYDKFIAAGFTESEAKEKAKTRSGLWLEYCRIINQVKPKWVIIENVDRLVKHGLEEVLNDLAKIRYDAEWAVIQASHIGAKHKRPRVWIVAYPCEQRHDGNSREGRSVQANEERNDSYLSKEWKQCKPESGPNGKIFSERFMQAIENSCSRKWAVEPNIPRVVDGLPKELERSRKQRIKQLGNAIVPQIAELIGREIMNYEKNNK